MKVKVGKGKEVLVSGLLILALTTIGVIALLERPSTSYDSTGGVPG